METNTLGGSANSDNRMHTRDCFEVFQEVLGELIRMGLVPGVVREKGKLNGKGLEVIRHDGCALLWRRNSSREAVAETLAHEEGSGP